MLRRSRSGEAIVVLAGLHRGEYGCYRGLQLRASDSGGGGGGHGMAGFPPPRGSATAIGGVKIESLGVGLGLSRQASAVAKRMDDRNRSIPRSPCIDPTFKLPIICYFIPNTGLY